MAGYNSIGAYEATSVIPEFKGLMQYGDGIGTDPRFAVDARNVETVGGVLQPAAKCSLMTPSLTNPIETLARLYRRWYTGNDSKELLVAASGGKLYSMLPTDSAWTQLSFPSGVSSYDSNVWSWVAYETTPEGADDPVDVLLLSNAQDGMVMIRGDNLSVTAVTTPKKFGVIERYAERIWGGAIPDDPDMLVYSAPYDPTDWEANEEIPEDGAGDIQQPSWDGDSFTALRTFGSQLIAFKRTRVWRILGTDPGEYAFKEQYGGGATYENTIAVDNERILMLGKDGVKVYDGLSVSPFQQDMCREIWLRLNYQYLDKASAVLWNNKYYCAVPIDGSTINNAVIIYDTQEGTWLYRDDVSVENWLGTEEKLYFTSSTTPGRIWTWEENSWETGSVSDEGTRWVSPWNDLGTKRIVKGGFEVYILPEVRDDPVTLTISLQTEKKIKTKQYTVQPLPKTKNLLNIAAGTHNHWSFVNIPNTLKNGTTYTFSIQGTTGYTYTLYLGNGTQSTRALSTGITAGQSATFTTPYDMTAEPLLCLAGSVEGAGDEKIEDIKPQVEMGLSKTDYEPFNDAAVNKNHKQKRIHFGGSGRRFRLIIESNKTAIANPPPWRLVSGILIVSETDPD